jgi:hypothetical protein
MTEHPPSSPKAKATKMSAVKQISRLDIAKVSCPETVFGHNRDN